MDKEAQRIAIGKACKTRTLTSQGVSTPDYLNDLNAMHKAEKVLDGLDRFPNPRLVYYDNLRYVCRNPEPTNCWSATATQRAEAFLKTLGLWEGDASNLDTVATDTAKP